MGRVLWKESSLTFQNGKQTEISITGGMSVAPQIPCWNPPWNGQCWEEGLWEVRRSRRGHEVELSSMGQVPSEDLWEDVLSLSALTVWGRNEKAASAAWKRVPTRTQHTGTLTTAAQPPEPWEMHFMPIRHPVVVTCYSSPSGPRQYLNVKSKNSNVISLVYSVKLSTRISN